MESLFTADTVTPAQALQGDGQAPTPGVMAPVTGKEAAPPEATQAEATQESPGPLDGQAPAPGVMAPDAESETAPAEAGQESPCPRCGGKLVNPTSLGWCPKCGYCRSLDEDGPKVPLSTESAARQTSPLGIVEFSELLAKLPRWLWITLAGAVGILVVSWAADLVLPVDSLPRALWSTLQVVLGLLALLAAQVWALIVLAPHDDLLGPKDIVLSARLWGLICRKLPDMRRQLWAGAWGVAAVLCAVGVVGGFSYWYQFYHPKKLADRSLLSAIRDAAQGKEKVSTLMESVEDFAGKQDLTKKRKDEEKDKPKLDKRPTVHCAVIGYIVEEDKTLSGLVLAALSGERLSYVGVVKRGFTPEASKELLQRLAPLVRPTPYFPNLSLSAIWVKPDVLCEIHQSGYDEQGHLKDPNFGGVLDSN